MAVYQAEDASLWRGRQRPGPSALGHRAGAIAMCPRSAPAARGSRDAQGQKTRWRASRPVGRVLCTRLRGPTAIHLGLPLPTASCGLPASIGRAALDRSRRKRCHKDRFPFGLAPGGVYLAAQVTLSAGGLLHHRFTLTSRGRSRGGGLFSVALSRGSPRVGVTDHPALRSPDLPRHTHRAARPPGRLARLHKSILRRAPRGPTLRRSCDE
jgi:hypothetical protein